MALTVLLIQITIVAALVIPPTVAQGGCHSLWVELESWAGNGRDHVGERCDTRFMGRACDPKFYICVDTKHPQDRSSSNSWRGVSMDSCDYSKSVTRTKKYRGQNSVQFPTGSGALGRRASNPLYYESVRRSWQKARVYVQVVDHDAFVDDLIDYHQFDLEGVRLDGGGARWAYPYSPGEVAPNWQAVEDKGQYVQKTDSKMRIQYKAQCCRHYYNYDCSVYCVAQNSKSRGFYTCDPKTGDKVCRDGYKDPSTHTPCSTMIDPCSAHTCQNGGTHYTTSQGACACVCPSGFTGSYCSSRVNYCGSSPCQNGGTCANGVDGFICICPSFYTGDKCQFTRCQTADLVCKNGGTCVAERQGCVCPAPFTGHDCSTCDCSGHGTCDQKAGSCLCDKGWNGAECDHEMCLHKPCLHGGSCEAGECVCPELYTGEYCEIANTGCNTNPCKNGGTCNPLQQGYRCECTTLFYGNHCENKVDNVLSPAVASALTENTDKNKKAGSWVYVYSSVGVVTLLIIVIIIGFIALRCHTLRRRKNSDSENTQGSDTHVPMNGIFAVSNNLYEEAGPLPAKLDSEEPPPYTEKYESKKDTQEDVLPH